MANFEYKRSKIISVNLINFKKRLFILDESLCGSDNGLIAVYEDGQIEILYLDCLSPSYAFSSEIFEIIDPIRDFDEIKLHYVNTLGDDVNILIDDYKELGLDIWNSIK